MAQMIIDLLTNYRAECLESADVYRKQSDHEAEEMCRFEAESCTKAIIHLEAK